VATKYPLSELDRELEEARTPQTLNPPPVAIRRSPPPPSSSDLMLSAVFGSLAPQVKNVSRFLASPTGSKVAMVGGVALASLLAPKVIP
jgi:hypothetical protein